MRGYIDLHSHWVVNVDDGARSPEESAAILRGLRQIGFSTVYATPHTRPGMFENDAAGLRAAYARTLEGLAAVPSADLPEVHLASEHYFDSLVFDRMRAGGALPYPPLPGQQALRVRPILIEFPPTAFPAQAQARFFDLRRANLAAVLAHPERYNPVWADDACLDPLIDAGASLLLDLCSLVGKYGRAAQRAAEKLVEEGAYEAACSDAHRPEDAEVTARAIERLGALAGAGEVQRMLIDGPTKVLRGRGAPLA
ncbi:MAG TPA: protein tyrosine phosphatase [Polyangiaceae bacterium]|nr:protein tyrosine phosphatase [Polyangiaceae bacterium]